MTHIKTTIIALIAAASTALSADIPPEVAAARARYEAALNAASKPVRDRYIQELEQLKARAMSLKNLGLAVAFDQEIALISGKVVPTISPSSVQPPSEPISKVPKGFVNGDFTQADETGTPAFWKLGPETKLVSEGAQRFLRCEAPDAAPAWFLVCEQDIQVPPSAKTATATVKLRCKEQKTERSDGVRAVELKLEYRDAAGKPQSTYIKIPNRRSTWTRSEGSGTLVPGAERANVKLRVVGLAGQFDIDDFEISFK